MSNHASLVTHIRNPEPSAWGWRAHGDYDDQIAAFEPITALLSHRAGISFHDYRKGTLIRRARRRMELQGISDFTAYARYLRANPAEIDALFDDILIGVTAFFRDPEAWEELRREVIWDAVVTHRRTGEPIRVWVPGCATGEEPYSVAMLLLEALDVADTSVPIQIFATDIDVKALTVARAGRYPGRLLAPLPTERVRRFFVDEGSDYFRVKDDLRRCVVFARQNLIGDPPFSRLDVITCRNLFIYLELAVQQKVIELFHFALREGGSLFLGAGEGIGRRSDLFEPISSKWRIYRRI
jgi:two-component system CheB/CheR fusion protein